MKTLLTLVVAVLTLAATGASASTIDIFCSKKSGGNCDSRIILALEKMGCQPIAETIRCQPYEDKMSCDVQTMKCMEPTADLMFTTQCRVGSKVNLKRYDRGLTLTWWMGMFGSYIRDVCVEK